jgi:OOP family OmpA-OmpF porin
MAPPRGAKPVGRFVNRPRAAAAPPLSNPAPSNGSLGPLLIGILLLAGVGWFAVDHYSPRIQEDLLDRSRASLEAEGMGDNTDVSIDGRNITITGTVADQQMSDRAEELVGGTFGVRSVNNELVIGDAAAQQGATDNLSEPTLGITAGDGKVTLSGVVSDQKFAQSLKDNAIAQYGEDNVIDELQIDENATNPGWIAAVNELQTDMAGVEGSALSIQDGTLTLTGTAADEEQKEAIGSKAQALLAGQLEVDNQLEAPEPAAPSLPAFASVQETETDIVLNGFMSEEGAQQIVQAYESTGKTVVNNISINELAETPAWGENFGGALSAMQSVTDGKLTVARSGNIRLQGTVETDEQKQSVGDSVTEMFSGSAISNDIEVVPPPVVPTMTPFASVVQTPGKIMLSGLLPEEAADQLLKSFRDSGADVSDSIAIDERVMQPQWAGAMAQSLSQLDGIEDGAVSVTSGGEVVVRGAAESEEMRNAAGQRIAGLFGDSVSLRNDISVKAPIIVEPPKPDLAELLAQIDLSGILFKSGSAEIDGNSVDILDQVVGVLSQFENVSVVIAGHTDSRGNADYNFNLSANRADAVRQYMISQGIPASQLTARGYGPTQPIASNDTAEGRARNRRIEFQLTGE